MLRIYFGLRYKIPFRNLGPWIIVSTFSRHFPSGNPRMMVKAGNVSLSEASAMRDVTSEQAVWVGSVVLKFCLSTLPAIATVVTNALNMAVFCQLGLNSVGGLNQNFLLLSLSDFLYGVIQTIICLVLIVDHLDLWRSPLTPQSIYKLANSASGLPYFSSVIITTVIAVVRCYSVVLPLKVTAIATPQRQLAAIFLFVCIYSGFSLNLYSCLRLTWRNSSSSSSSSPPFSPQLTVTTCPDFSRRQGLLDVCRSLVLYTFTLVAACLLILLVALKRYSRFKTSEVTTSNTRRDVQVARTVTLVSAIFVLCNLPAMVAPILRQVWPGFRLRGHLGKSFHVVLMYIEMNILINASANAFVFYRSSSQYRKTFKRMFGKVE